MTTSLDINFVDIYINDSVYFIHRNSLRIGKITSIKTHPSHNATLTIYVEERDEFYRRKSMLAAKAN